MIFLQRCSRVLIWVQRGRDTKILRCLKENDNWPGAWNLHGEWRDLKKLEGRNGNGEKQGVNELKDSVKLGIHYM